MSVEEKAQRERSIAIDKQIERDSKLFRNKHKILLLGSGESGKSTIMKQMKIIYQNGYTREELMTCRYTVYKNLVESAQWIVSAMHKIGVDQVDTINRQYLGEISAFQLPKDINSYSLPEYFATAVESVWNDPLIAQVMDGSDGLYPMVSAGYFLDQVRRICAKGYIPDEADVLHAQEKSAGITEIRFNMGQLSIHMFDIGGQRSERRKWIHRFEAVTSILFCVALSEYDQVLLDEKEQNRMVESLVLFGAVVGSRWFLRTSIILLFNKTDIFKAKLLKVPLERYFPGYTGGPDPNKAAKYILYKFMEKNRARFNIYPHLIQATNTFNMQSVFLVVKETILQNTAWGSGIL